jgi:hypothetical protein
MSVYDDSGSDVSNERCCPVVECVARKLFLGKPRIHLGRLDLYASAVLKTVSMINTSLCQMDTFCCNNEKLLPASTNFLAMFGVIFSSCACLSASNIFALQL